MSKSSSRTSQHPSLSEAGLGEESRIWLGVVLLALSTILVYATVFAAPFVFDDVPQIVANVELDELWPGAARFFGRQRTVTTLTFALNRAAGGLDPAGYRAVNLLVHVLAGLTLFGVVRRTLLLPRLGTRYGPMATGLGWAAAWLWLLHPLQTQSVTYVVQRAESLMGLFYLLALYATIRSSTSPAANSTPLRWQGLALISCALGMGSKPVMATAPLVILAFDRLLLAGSWRELARKRALLYAGFASTWLLIGASGLVPALLGTGAAAEPTAGFGMKEVGAWEYLLTQPGVVLHYLRLALWPDELVLDYGWPMADSPADALVPALVLGVVLSASLVGLVRGRPIAFLGLWFFAILAPSSSFVPLRDAAFEHRMYLPLAAVTTGVVLLVPAILRAFGGRMASETAHRLALGMLLLAGMSLGARTWARNRDYRDELALWRATVRDAPENGRGYNLLALALAERGLHSEAIAVLESGMKRLEERKDAERQRVQRAVTHNTWGNLLRALGRGDDAIAHYRLALELEPSLTEAHCNWGAALRTQGRYAEALERYEMALRLEPGASGTLNNLAWLLATCPLQEYRDGARALELAQQAAEATHYRDPALLDTLSAALAESREFDAAVRWQTRAVELASERARPTYQARLEAYRNGQPIRE